MLNKLKGEQMYCTPKFVLRIANKFQTLGILCLIYWDSTNTRLFYYFEMKMIGKSSK